MDTPKKSSWTTEVLSQTHRARGGAHGRAGDRAQIWLPVAARVPTGRPAAEWWRGTGTGEGEGEESSGRRLVAWHGHRRRLGFRLNRGDSGNLTAPNYECERPDLGAGNGGSFYGRQPHYKGG